MFRVTFALVLSVFLVRAFVAGHLGTMIHGLFNSLTALTVDTGAQDLIEEDEFAGEF